MIISVTVTITSKFVRLCPHQNSSNNFEVMVTVTEIAKGAFDEQ